jgi:hypothetical protein
MLNRVRAIHSRPFFGWSNLNNDKPQSQSHTNFSPEIDTGVILIMISRRVQIVSPTRYFGNFNDRLAGVTEVVLVRDTTRLQLLS